MARKTQYKNILRMLLKGASCRVIEKQLHVSPKTIILCRQLFQNTNISEEELAELSEEKLKEILVPPKPSRKTKPDWRAVLHQITYEKRTIQETWALYQNDCQAKGQDFVNYSQFCNLFAQVRESAKFTASDDLPGETVFVQWLSPVTLHDSNTGNILKEHILLGVLPYSQNIFFKCVSERNLKTWIVSVVEMLSFFGGAPKNIVSPKYKENFSKGQPVAQFLECAAHYGMLITQEEKVLKKEMDQIIKTIADSLEESYDSIAELHTALYDLVEAILLKSSGSQLSRKVVFEELEKTSLQKLPADPFEYYDELQCKLRFDYHVQCDGMYYSVPSHWSLQIDKTVTVRKTEKRISIYKWGDLIAEHQVLTGHKGQYSTCAEHMPTQETEQWYPWNRKRFLSWANQYGSQTAKTISYLLSEVEFEPQAYQTCFNILSLAKVYSPKALENACAALSEHKKISYSIIKQLADSFH